MTQIAYWANLGFPTYAPRTYHARLPGHAGLGLPDLARRQGGQPDKVVVSVNGDGGLRVRPQRAGDDGAAPDRHDRDRLQRQRLRHVRRIQQVSFDGRTIASHLQNPDYVKLAEAFGVTGRRADSPEALQTQMREAIAADEPT